MVLARVVALFLGLWVTAVTAQDFPTKPIRLIVPFAPGGATDFVTRILAENATKTLDTAIVVENRAGAGGTVGAQAVAFATPDGYTLLMGANGPLAIAPALYRNLPYDSDSAFAPITLAIGQPFVLVVHPSVRAKTLSDLLALAKAQPGKLNYGSGGNGSGPHLGMEMLKGLTSVNIVHVPYKSTGPMVTALLGGDVQVAISDITSVLPFIRSGRLRVLAVTTTKRSAALPDVPTMEESGLAPFDLLSWVGVLAPAGTPASVIARLNQAFNDALRSPNVGARLASIDAFVYATSPEEFRAFIAVERKKWQAVVTSDMRLD